MASFSAGSTRAEALVKESVGACEPKKHLENVRLRRSRGGVVVPQPTVWGAQLRHCDIAFHQHVVSSPITGMETSQSLTLERTTCASLRTSLTRDP